MVAIYNQNFSYVGSLERIPQNENYKWKANYSKTGVFNVNDEIPLFEQNITLFKGLIDYKEKISMEDYKTFAQKAKKKQLSRIILHLCIFLVVSLSILCLEVVLRSQ